MPAAETTDRDDGTPTLPEIDIPAPGMSKLDAAIAKFLKRKKEVEEAMKREKPDEDT